MGQCKGTKHSLLLATLHMGTLAVTILAGSAPVVSVCDGTRQVLCLPKHRCVDAADVWWLPKTYSELLDWLVGDVRWY